MKLESIELRFNKFIAFLTFLITSLVSFSLGEIFYNSVDGTDFYRYFNYIEYFSGEIDSPSREQGLFYFWIISISIEKVSSFFVNENWENIFSTGIQIANFLIYLIGVVGLIYLLRQKKIPWEKIFLSCSVLNLFPPVFGGRLIMKPEIIAFALLPWILVAINQYFIHKSNLFLIFASTLFSIIATSKGTIALISSFAIFMIFYDKIKLINIRDLLIPGIIFFVSFFLLYFENTNINSISFANHPEEQSYLFKANLSFLYNINFLDLYFNPFRNHHADSLIGITLLDMFNDYFNRYWEHPRSLFFADREKLFGFLEFPRRNLSLLLATLFVAYSLKERSKFKLLYLSGIIILTLTSLGLFGLHFNPQKGDTLKTHYYFFLLGISFVFIFLDFIKSNNYWKNYLCTIFTVLLFLFIFGFPKNYSVSTESKILDKIPSTISCNYTKYYFNQVFLDNINCSQDRPLSLPYNCGSSEDFNTPIFHEDGYLIFVSDDNFEQINLKDKFDNVVTVNGFAECFHYVEGGYYKYSLDSLYFITVDPPRYNNAFLYVSLFSIFGIILLPRKKIYSSSE